MSNSPTLATSVMINASGQEVFDFVVNHLRAQGKRCSNEIYACSYRGYNDNDEQGKKLACAIGCLIPDSLYCTWMEGGGVTNLIERLRNHIKELEISPPLAGSPQKEYERLVSFLLKNYRMLVSLQGIHDMNEPSDWEKVFKATASGFNVNYRPIVSQEQTAT